jgi:catechol 2,3-dioxygenase
MITRRSVLKLAGGTMSLALAGAARAEPFQLLGDQSSAPLFATSTPIHVGSVSLWARDMENLARYYQVVLGLDLLGTTAQQIDLGVGQTKLLTLVSRPDATSALPSQAGLYHTAFLMPSRTDLARWLVHVAALRVQLSGFADHLVSEAVYLNDPEGNGIEVYADRPSGEWKWDTDQVVMGTEELDIDGLLFLVPTDRDTYSAVPSGMRIGHIHLRGGSVQDAKTFYSDMLGLDVVRGSDNAVFMSSGGYHHHLAVNIWESAGAGIRPSGTTGLASFSLATDLVDARQRLTSAGILFEERDGQLSLADPWGTRVELVSKIA